MTHKHTPHTSPGGIDPTPVLVSCPTDADIRRTIDAAPPAPCEEECLPEPPHSREVMEAYERAKQAGEKNDMRSRRIVRQQWQEREGDVEGAPAMRGQTAIFDFRRHGHPTQKPFDLIKRIVLTSSNAGDLVCDPAMGTGTTMKVCEVYDRNFVGAEIAAEYELAIKARGMTHTPPLTSYL